MQSIKKVCVILFFAVSLYVFLMFCSCQKKEPAVSPDPKDISNKVSKDLNLSGDFAGTIYNSEDNDQKLNEEKAKELYSEDKSKSVDISKAEKYFIMLGTNNSANEIGIFKLYDTAAVGYVKDMAKARILAVQQQFNETMPETESVTANAGEVREYGNYIYYVVHKDKDKIFKSIEDMLKGNS